MNRTDTNEAAAGAGLVAAHWACPCGQDSPKPGGATPVATIVSLREPACPFCGEQFREEYRRR